MGSNKKYYERKAAGECTKCAAPLGDSPSSVRCRDCYLKFKKSRSDRKVTRASSGLCIQCGEAPSIDNTNYCEECRERNSEIKLDLGTNYISKYKESNTACRVCNSPIDTLGVICQECLSSQVFTLKDAITRYRTSCRECLIADTNMLRLVSYKIEEPMPLRGAELYRTICFSSNAPAEYDVMCQSCYREACINYIKEIRELFGRGTRMSSGQDLVDI